jgi:hypothetical protein
LSLAIIPGRLRHVFCLRGMASIYSRPGLRERIKERIKAGGRGGPKGKWSLRKSALLKHDYEQAGGGYRSAKRTPAQRRMKRRLEKTSARSRQR